MRWFSIPYSVHYCHYNCFEWNSNQYLVEFNANWIARKENHKFHYVCMNGEMLLMTFAKLLSPHNKHNGIAKHRGRYYLCLTSFEHFHVCVSVCVREFVYVSLVSRPFNIIQPIISVSIYRLLKFKQNLLALNFFQFS